jgi:sugar/nucleoside kinase (ribokinase family)
VSPHHIDRARRLFREYGRAGIALALPEVKLEARLRLLELGGRHGLFRAASFTSMEIEHLQGGRVLKNMDLLALNLDEASRVAGAGSSAEDTCVRAFSALREIQPDLRVSVTAGKGGSWTWDGERVSHVPAVQVDPVSTAGAGDAFLAGLLAGTVIGLTLPESQLVASLCGSFSVTSPHTIHKGLGWRSLHDLARAHIDEIGDALGGRTRGVLGLDG